MPAEATEPCWSERLYVRLPRGEIAFFKFLLESYENLVLLSVVDRFEAVVQLRFAPGQREELLEVLKGLQEEIDLNLLNIPILG